MWPRRCSRPNPYRHACLGIPTASALTPTVKRYLVNEGIDGARMTTPGYGENRPMATNDTAATRAQSRRLELDVTGP